MKYIYTKTHYNNSTSLDFDDQQIYFYHTKLNALRHFYNDFNRAIAPLKAERISGHAPGFWSSVCSSDLPILKLGYEDESEIYLAVSKL